MKLPIECFTDEELEAEYSRRYAMKEQAVYHCDQIFGSSEDGLHGGLS